MDWEKIGTKYLIRRSRYLPKGASAVWWVFPFSLYKGTLGPKTWAIMRSLQIELLRKDQIGNWVYPIPEMIGFPGGWESTSNNGVSWREGPLMAWFYDENVPRERHAQGRYVEEVTGNTFQQGMGLRNFLAEKRQETFNLYIFANRWHMARCLLIVHRCFPKANLYWVSSDSPRWENDKLALTSPDRFIPRELAAYAATKIGFWPKILERVMT